MKVGVLMNIYNEVEWLPCSLGAVLDWADEIVVVEGAWQVAINVGANPRSTDGTLELLDEFKKKENITVLHENAADNADQLNKGLEILKQKGVEWLLLVDADEVWQPIHLGVIKNYMKIADKKGIYQYKIHAYNFINSFDNFYDGEMKRIYKVTPGCTFTCTTENMSWPDHNKSVDVGIPQPWFSHLPPQFRCFHYTEIRSRKRWELQVSYVKGRNPNDQYIKNYYVDKDGFHIFTDNFKKFKGIHPEIVRNTDLYKMWEKNPEDLRKFLFEC